MLAFLGQAAAQADSAAVDLTNASFWTGMLDYLKDNGPDLGLKLLAAIAIFWIGRIVAGAVRGGLKKVMNARGVDPSLTGFVSSLAYFAIIAFTIVAVIGEFGVETASFIAILGAAGFAVGMALQGTLANFASGVMLLLFRPFKPGDFIEAAGVKGLVKETSRELVAIGSPQRRSNSQASEGQNASFV